MQHADDGCDGECVKTFAVAVLTALALGASAGAAGPWRNGLIAFERCCGFPGTGIYVIAPDGSNQHRLFEPNADDVALAPAWSPDGTQIAFTPGSPSGLWVMQANGAKPHRITAGRGEPGAPSWSGDGTRIVFSDRSSRAGYYDLYVVRRDGTGLRRLTSASANEASPAWAPDGREIVYVRGSDVWRMRPDGTGQRLLLRNADSPSWSPGGTHLAFVRGGKPWIANRSGAEAKRVAEIPVFSLAWSPDGQWLVTAPVDRGDLLLVRTNGSRSRRLTHESGLFHGSPSWQRISS
jgi:TolB protein